MRRCWPWLLLFLNALLAARCPAQGRVDCNQLPSHILGESVHYCVMLPAGYDAAISGHSPRRYPVLYFLHGLGDNEQSLFKGGGWDLVQDLRQTGQVSDFLVVAPEGRRTFYINSAGGRVRYSDFFIREFIPYIESHYSVRRERAARAISGFSMGGYGALRFALAHPELFSSVSAESAALVTEMPPPGKSGPLALAFGDPIDVHHWNDNSPFALAKRNQKHIRASGLAIYFNCGTGDEFGFYQGAAELHRQLQAEDIPHEYHLYPGNHGAEYFLAHLPEVLKFHTRIFAAAK